MNAVLEGSGDVLIIKYNHVVGHGTIIASSKSEKLIGIEEGIILELLKSTRWYKRLQTLSLEGQMGFFYNTATGAYIRQRWDDDIQVMVEEINRLMDGTLACIEHDFNYGNIHEGFKDVEDYGKRLKPIQRPDKEIVNEIHEKYANVFHDKKINEAFFKFYITASVRLDHEKDSSSNMN